MKKTGPLILEPKTALAAAKTVPKSEIHLFCIITSKFGKSSNFGTVGCILDGF